MIDMLALMLTHSLMLYAYWRMLSRPDLDTESPGGEGPPPAARARAPTWLDRDDAEPDNA